MRILFVTNCYPTEETPGSCPFIAQRRTSLQQLGYEVDLLLINGKQTRLNYLKAMWRVFWTSQISNQYDLVHAHYGYCGVVARMQFRCPVVVTFLGSDVLRRPEGLLSWLVARCVDGVIVPTEEMKQVLGRNDVHVIPWGIDFGLFKPRAQAAARRELGLPLDVPLVLFPYNPERTLKRFDLVEQAVAILKREYPDIQVLVIYDKPHKGVTSYMNACDVIALASDSEGSPNTIKEAMACNLPIVSVDIGDVRQIIADTEGCYLCEQEAGDLAEKMSWALGRGKRTNGARVVRKLDASWAAEQVVSVYKSVLDKKRKKRQ